MRKFMQGRLLDTGKFWLDGKAFFGLHGRQDQWAIHSVVEFYTAVPQASHVKVSIFDISGRQVNILADADYQPGTYQVQWNGQGQNGQSLSTGVYNVSSRLTTACK